MSWYYLTESDLETLERDGVKATLVGWFYDDGNDYSFREVAHKAHEKWGGFDCGERLVGNQLVGMELHRVACEAMHHDL